MLQKDLLSRFIKSKWKRKKIIGIILVIFIGIIIILLGYSINSFYNIFFSVCLGLLIGGILMSIISTVLAEMSTHDLHGTDHFDHVDHLDHFDYVDHLDHIDHVDHLDHFDYVDHLDHIDHVDHLDHIDHVDHLDHIDHVDHLDYIDHADHLDHVDHADHFDHVDHVDHFDHVNHLDHVNDATPAPFMLLFSTSLLLFGILGILFFYIFAEKVQFLIFFTTITITYIFTKLLSTSWKKIAKSRFYNISSTKNLIGVKGKVVLNVDKKGGIIKIVSNTPMKFEKVHVKPLNPDSYFEEGVKVYICDVKDGFFLVDNDIKSIRYRRW